MSQSYEDYDELANEFIQEVRQRSPAAADCLEQIRTHYGAHPAYLAAFALVMLTQRISQRGYSSPQQALESFTYSLEMQGDAEAIRLYHEAAAHLLQA